MQTLFKASRFALPVAFFGYAAVVNLGYAEFPAQRDLAFGGDILRGGLAAEVDSVYRQALPHREPAIGVIGALRYLTVGEGRAGVVTGSDGWLFTAEEIRPMSGDMAAQVRRITQVRDRLAEEGARLVVVPVPGKLDVHVDRSAPETAVGITDLYDSFVAGLADQGVPTLDARAALQAEAALRLAFFRTDTHWTPAGARAVAEALAGSGLIAAGDAEFSVEPGLEERFTGDLVTYVTTEGLAPLIGLAPEVVAPYTATAAVDAGEVDIFGGADAGATLLIGTSYSANPTWSFAEALKLALGRDVLNLAVEGQGPARPMLDYLASPDFRATPPEIVIWEFPVRFLSDPSIWDKDSGGANGA